MEFNPILRIEDYDGPSTPVVIHSKFRVEAALRDEFDADLFTRHNASLTEMMLAIAGEYYSLLLQTPISRVKVPGEIGYRSTVLVARENGSISKEDARRMGSQMLNVWNKRIETDLIPIYCDRLYPLPF